MIHFVSIVSSYEKPMDLVISNNKKIERWSNDQNNERKNKMLK